MKRWLVDEETGKRELQQVNPKTGTWETIKEPDPRFEYGLFPLIREAILGQRKIKWIGIKQGFDASLYYDSGTDFRP